MPKARKTATKRERRQELRRTIDKADFYGYRAILIFGIVFLLVWAFLIQVNAA